MLVDKILRKYVVPIAGEHDSLGERLDVALQNLSIIKVEGDRLTRLLDDMLDVSKIEAGRMEWRDTELSLRITSYNVCYTKLLRAVQGRGGETGGRR